MTIYVQEASASFQSTFYGIWRTPITATVRVITHQSLRYLVFPNIIAVQNDSGVITTLIPSEFAPLIPTLMAGIGLIDGSVYFQSGFSFDQIGNITIATDLNGTPWSLSIGLPQPAGIPAQVIGPFPIS